MNRPILILSILLGVSVAANLLVAGMMLGRQASPSRLPDGPPRSDRAAFAVVPKELHARVKERMSVDGSEAKAEVRGIREARQAMADALRARPFDADAAAGAAAELRRRSDLAQQRLHSAVIAEMAAAQANGILPPPQERRAPRRREGGPDGGPPGGPPGSPPDRAPDGPPPRDPPPRP